MTTEFKMVKVSDQGVQFGNAWYSHESITGCSADQLNQGNCCVTGGAYMKWLAAAPASPQAAQPVAWQYRVSAGPQTGWSLWHDGKGEEFKQSYQVETRPLYAEQPAPVAANTMKSVMAAICSIEGFPMLTSDQCHALAQKLNTKE